MVLHQLVCPLGLEKPRGTREAHHLPSVRGPARHATGTTPGRVRHLSPSPPSALGNRSAMSDNPAEPVVAADIRGKLIALDPMVLFAEPESSLYRLSNRQNPVSLNRSPLEHTPASLDILREVAAKRHATCRQGLPRYLYHDHVDIAALIRTGWTGFATESPTSEPACGSVPLARPARYLTLVAASEPAVASPLQVKALHVLHESARPSRELDEQREDELPRPVNRLSAPCLAHPRATTQRGMRQQSVNFSCADMCGKVAPNASRFLYLTARYNRPLQ